MELVEWRPEGHDEAWNITQALYYEDGGRRVEGLIKEGGEEMLPLTKWLIKDNENVRYRTVEEIWDVSFPYSVPLSFFLLLFSSLFLFLNIGGVCIDDGVHSSKLDATPID